ncbi:MAG: NUDIX domain-containing protein [Pseudomonadota bacterium]|nr:NUDIX domain-containing protein [Pseudomonadota bacterium]
MRPLIDLAHRVRRFAMRAVRWRTTGVKAMVFNPTGELLMIRHRYGNTKLWMLPGGGVERGETLAAAAAREVREETECVVAGIAALGSYRARGEGLRDTVHLFRGITDDVPVADGVEVAEAAFFALDALPETTSPATKRRIAELIGQRAPTGDW